MKLIALVGFCSENFMWIRVSIPILTKFGTVMGLDLQTASAIKISNYKRKPAKKNYNFHEILKHLGAFAHLNRPIRAKSCTPELNRCVCLAYGNFYLDWFMFLPMIG